jgi:hypothetical protein
VKLEQIYKDIIEEAKLIPEIGEGSSKTFPFKKLKSSGTNAFLYNINGEIRNDTGAFVLQEIPIRLFGNHTSMIMDEDYTDKEILDFFGKNDFSTINGFEITFSKKGDTYFNDVNDRVFMFRLMATIKKILQDEFAKADPDYIVYAPTKQGDEDADKTGRHKLYSAFIKKAIPGAQMFYNKKDDEIIYKLK